MKRIAKFEKVSLEQFREAYIDTYGSDESLNEVYDLSLIHI